MFNNILIVDYVLSERHEDANFLRNKRKSCNAAFPLQRMLKDYLKCLKAKLHNPTNVTWHVNSGYNNHCVLRWQAWRCLAQNGIVEGISFHAQILKVVLCLQLHAGGKFENSG